MKKSFLVTVEAPDRTGGITEAVTTALDRQDSDGRAITDYWTVTVTEAPAREAARTALRLLVSAIPAEKMTVAMQDAGELLYDLIMTAEILAAPEPLLGSDVIAGAGPDSTCGCGYEVTMYDGTWMHVLNPELCGTDDHDAHPADDFEYEEDEDES